MGADFLGKFLRVARTITQAERGMAVDANFTLLDAINLTPQMIESRQFSDVAEPCLQRAQERNEAIITNNIITDPSQAPVTNTNFTDLRVVVVIPIKGQGAIYLDQHIRRGIIARDTIDKLMRLGAQIVDNGLEASSESEILALYKGL
jgi:hypothetical protein